MAIDDMPRGFAPGVGEERRGEESKESESRSNARINGGLVD
jgi:hypothetical protein